MQLAVVSAVVVVLQVLLQHLRVGLMWDVLTPMLVAVGLGAPRGRAVAWVIAMGVGFTAAMRVHPLVLIGVWLVAVGALGAAGRGLEWHRRPVSFAVAALTSIGWQVAMLLLNWFGGVAPTLDGMCVLSLLGRAVTAGLVFVICGEQLVAAVQPTRVTTEQRALRRRRDARE